MKKRKNYDPLTFRSDQISKQIDRMNSTVIPKFKPLFDHKIEKKEEARISLLTTKDFKKRLDEERNKYGVNMNVFCLKVLEEYLDGHLVYIE